MNRYAKLILVLTTAVLIFFVAEIVMVGSKIPYRFINTDHPIDMVLDDGGQWMYYSLSGAPSDVAKNARAELLPLGFQEDFSNKPWFSFKKGHEQVVVCNHDEIMVMGGFPRSKVVHEKPLPGRPKDSWAVAWVRRPGGTSLQSTLFQIKKLILQW